VTTHFHILGAGAIGRLFAFRLASAGNEVTLIRRSITSDHVTLAIQVEEQTLQHTFRQQRSDDPQTIDHLWITTKSYDVVAAAESVRHRLSPRSTVAVLANGMGYHEKLSKVCAPAQLLAGITTAGAKITDTGALVTAGSGMTRLGWWRQTGDPPDWFESLASDDWTCLWETDIQDKLLEKLALNAVINPATALLDIDNGALLEPPYRVQLIEAREEVRQLLIWGGCEKAAEDLDARLTSVLQDTANNSSSMRTDTQLGRRTEVNAILGYLLTDFGDPTAPRPATPLLSAWFNALQPPLPTP